jgi:hypothetical protein
MFDNMNRLFSRKGTDREEIATNSAILEDVNNNNYDEPQRENIERDIDEMNFDAPVINDLVDANVEGPALDDVPVTPAADDILSSNDVLLSVGSDDDDDFESI